MPAERRDWRAFRPASSLSRNAERSRCRSRGDSNGSMDIAHGVQNDGRRMVSSPFIVRREGSPQSLEDTERSVARSSCNHGYILWGNRSLECLVAPKLIPSCAIWEADGRVLSSSHFVTNMTEIRTCHGKVYPAYLSEIALQMQGQRFADGEDTPCIIGLLFILLCPM